MRILREAGLGEPARMDSEAIEEVLRPWVEDYVQNSGDVLLDDEETLSRPATAITSVWRPGGGLYPEVKALSAAIAETLPASYLRKYPEDPDWLADIISKRATHLLQTHVVDRWTGEVLERLPGKIPADEELVADLRGAPRAGGPYACISVLLELGLYLAPGGILNTSAGDAEGPDDVVVGLVAQVVGQTGGHGAGDGVRGQRVVRGEGAGVVGGGAADVQVAGDLTGCLEVGGEGAGAGAESPASLGERGQAGVRDGELNGVGVHADATGSLRLRGLGFSSVSDSADLEHIGYIDPWSLELQSAYLNLYCLPLAPVDISIGKQEVGWGVGDKLRTYNEVNPGDYEDPLDFGEYLGVNMVRLTAWFSATWRLEGLFVPTFTPARLPAQRWQAQPEMDLGEIMGMPLWLSELSSPVELPEASLAESA